MCEILKNNLKVLLFSILIFTVALSLCSVSAADCDNSTIGLADNETNLNFIENSDYTLEATIDDSNQNAVNDSVALDSNENSDLKEQAVPKVKSPALKSNADSSVSVLSADAKAGSNNVYVNYTGGKDANSGSNWKNAVKTIEKSLQLVNDGGVIHDKMKIER